MRLFLLLLFFTFAAYAQVPVPPLSARVTDLTGTLAADQRAALEGQLAQFEKQKGSQIVVLIVPTTQPEAIEQYGIRVAEAWKVGRKGVDDGVILLVAKDDRALRIEVGYGLEGALPDAIAKRIVDEVIVPRFKEGDFYGGISAGVDRIIRVVDGEPLPEPAPQSTSGGSINSDAVFTAVVPAVIFGGLLRMFMGRLPGAGVAGVLSAIVVWFVLSSVLAAALIGLLSFVLVMFGGSGMGGFGGRGGGGWSSGGGFSGGGGGFGGGGASGRW